MHLVYTLVHHDISEKSDDDAAPMYSIVLTDLDGELSKPPYCMSKQLKDFSLAMQKYGLAWSEKYHEYIIPFELFLSQTWLKQYLDLIQDTLDRLNRGENIVSEEERDREATQSYYTAESAVTYLQEVFRWSFVKNDNPIILDPAAGEGRLTDGIPVSKSSIWLVEPDKKCCDLLKQKGYIHVINTGFEDAIANNLLPTPTHIIMNPPFSHQQDIKFYNLACRLLKDNGVISAIISMNSIDEELHQYGLSFDECQPIAKAKNILASTHSQQLSGQIREFFANIANSKHLFADYTSEFDFENTCARAMFFRGVVKGRSEIEKPCRNNLDDEER